MRNKTPMAIAASLSIIFTAFSLTPFDRLYPGVSVSLNSPAGFEQPVKEQRDSDGPDSIDKRPVKLTPHPIRLSKTRKFDLYLPEDFEITIAAQGLKRVRFMAKSPDNRIFVTDMFDRTDNGEGAVYILEDFDAKSGKFGKVTPYLTGLRNPNSIAFHTDVRGNHWFYLALTDRLVRYNYAAGKSLPSGSPEVLAAFPDYGLSYKYGGWHLTRTITIGNGKLYISVGSSCNSCEETEAVRASVLEMDLDGKNQRAFAVGLRNAVGLKWVEGQLFATNMGADHLGDFKPDDSLFVVEQNKNYGWPYCYEYRNQIYADDQFSKSRSRVDCKDVPLAYIAFSAHSSPLGFEYFDSTYTARALKNYFLVALHGSSKRSLKRGYSVMRVKKGARVQDFITGFLRNGRIYGRPADVMSFGKNAFLVTDDHSGRVYYVFQKEKLQKKGDSQTQ
ncbi:MAG: PQQ-dependent sugar dehydrogenase [Blastocatellia bacterium]|nr:PQQ-dependent sugar dehydrogenase [Blastocatellia bacterium]